MGTNYYARLNIEESIIDALDEEGYRFQKGDFI